MTIDTNPLESNAPGTTGEAIGYGVVIPFVQHLGIELIEQGRERALVRLARKDPQVRLGRQGQLAP